VTSTTTTRMPAAERRRKLVETAVRVFSEGSYRGTTTAEIARAAGVSEPILYRHFASKRDLYLAALEHVWAQVQRSWEEALAEQPNVLAALDAIGRGSFAARDCKHQLSELWVQALSEATEDPVLRKYLRKHMREVHGYFAALLRRGQEEGVLHVDRDVDAEAWLFLSGSVLGMVGRRVGLMDDDEVRRIRSARLAWLAA
jgi:AcrR family transcriptional regulator